MLNVLFGLVVVPVLIGLAIRRFAPRVWKRDLRIVVVVAVVAGFVVTSSGASVLRARERKECESKWDAAGPPSENARDRRIFLSDCVDGDADPQSYTNFACSDDPPCAAKREAERQRVQAEVAAEHESKLAGIRAMCRARPDLCDPTGAYDPPPRDDYDNSYP